LLEVGRRHKIQLEGKSIGVIGVGNVGSRVVRKCEALGLHVLRNDPPLQRQTGDLKYVPIESLYDCDLITIHTPLTQEGIDKTFHLADGEFFSSLKRGAVLVNASRGAVVDTEALKAAIRKGRLRAVVLDVWEGEPDIDAELLERVDLGTPHIAGYSLDGKIAGMIMIYHAFCKYFHLPPRFDAQDFLPAPEVPRLELRAGGLADEDLLARAVEQVYSINRDDRDLRRIADQPPHKRGGYFDALRKNYPVRREFHNTTIVLHAVRQVLVWKLRGLEFNVEGSA